jgi:hypothetical protein
LHSFNVISTQGRDPRKAACDALRVNRGKKMFEAAWAGVRKYGASTGVKDALAQASETKFPREALAAYAEHMASFPKLS